MSKIALVTDSTCDLPESVVKDKNITVIPLNVHFGEETFLDGIDLQSNEFFEKLSTSEIHPQTSQPSVGRFVETYNDLLKKHDSILSLHISSKLSATYNSALQAQKEIGNEKIKVPQINWHELKPSKSGLSWEKSLLHNHSMSDAVYFVHSFTARPTNDNHVLADYIYLDKRISAVIVKDNIMGCQFHPEKSGKVGLEILKNFMSL